jgi:hypothetical protein
MCPRSLKRGVSPRDPEVNKLVVEALTPVQGGGIQWEDGWNA